MPWLRGEATGLPGLRTANLQRDHRSRLESSSFRAMEDVKPNGERRGRFYRASADVAQIWQRIRTDPRPAKRF
jgi:hypothetical protein